MEASNHPEYKSYTATYSCGNSFKIQTALSDDSNIEAYAEFHPFTLISRNQLIQVGRVQQFQERYITQTSRETGK